MKRKPQHGAGASSRSAGWVPTLTLRTQSQVPFDAQSKLIVILPTLLEADVLSVGIVLNQLAPALKIEPRYAI